MTMKDKIDCLNALVEHGVIGYQAAGRSVLFLLSNGNSLWIHAETDDTDEIGLQYELYTDTDYREHPHLWDVMRTKVKDLPDED